MSPTYPTCWIDHQAKKRGCQRVPSVRILPLRSLGPEREDRQTTMWVLRGVGVRLIAEHQIIEA